MNSSILACSLRGLSHERLAVTTAQLAVALQRIVEGRVSNPLDAAESALRNTAVLALQELVAEVHERQMPELFDAEVNRDELADRAESIHASLDAAFNAGYDEYRRDESAETRAAAWGHQKLVSAFMSGWSRAASEVEDVHA